MDKPSRPYATQPTPEDWARFHREVAPWYAAGHRLADEHHDPRPEDERHPHVAGGPGYALALVAAAGGIVVGLWALIVALDAIAGTL